MAILKNVSNHIKSVVINGKRKLVKPGRTFRGPDNLVSADIELVKSEQSTTLFTKLIPNQGIKETTVTNKKSYIPKPVITNKIESELEYLETLSNSRSLPSVSVAILTKNAEKLIKDCCESFLKYVRYPNLICNNSISFRKL